jgi:predicted acyl esterase
MMGRVFLWVFPMFGGVAMLSFISSFMVMIPSYAGNIQEDAKVPMREQVAEQTIYHDRDHPSHIILPVIPMGK